MKKKFKVKTIEDIALQFIRHTEPRIPQKKINSNDTIIDSKFYIKKYKKNPEQILSNSFSKLIPYEEDTSKPQEKKNNLKIIKFYKLPQKILGEEDEECFLDNKSIIQNTNNNTKTNFKSKLREIKPLKFSNKKPKIFFNINYKNVSESINKLYLPLLQNLESITSIKTNTESTINCITFFNSNDSAFDLLNTKEEKNEKNINNNNIIDLMTELKTFEVIDLSLVLFILHIILEAKIEYIDNFDEDDIVAIYQDCFLVLKKLYEIIILILHLNEKNNNLSNTNTCNTNKFVKDFFKDGNKVNNNEQAINKINENISSCLKTLYNSSNILLGNFILFKKESGNLENPDETENRFLSNLKANNAVKEEPKEKIFLSKEFHDQYNNFKTAYLYLTKNNNNNADNKKQKKENYDFLQQSDTSIILSKLTTVLSSFKEISNNLMLYFTNFKILLEKNKVKPPFLGPISNPNKIFTLVVDLDETLVHYVEEESRAYVQVRPYADYFLTEMGKYFEIVIFTAAAEDYADIVLDGLDKNNSIDYKLYRKHTEQINGVFIKDLSKLGRDINKVVIIDNNKDNFSLQPENGLHICSFIGDQNDDELYLLCDDLMKIVKGNKKDLRPAVKEIDAIMKKRYKSKNVVLE